MEPIIRPSGRANVQWLFCWKGILLASTSSLTRKRTKLVKPRHRPATGVLDHAHFCPKFLRTRQTCHRVLLLALHCTAGGTGNTRQCADTAGCTNPSVIFASFQSQLNQRWTATKRASHSPSSIVQPPTKQKLFSIFFTAKSVTIVHAERNASKRPIELSRLSVYTYTAAKIAATKTH
jgi:hypothetical protein